jgi:hypothetical protein
LLQRVFGANITTELFNQKFPAKTWLVSPTDDMRLFAATNEQLEKLSNMAKHVILEGDRDK